MVCLLKRPGDPCSSNAWALDDGVVLSRRSIIFYDGLRHDVTVMVGVQGCNARC
jgi:hypothetical protein